MKNVISFFKYLKQDSRRNSYVSYVSSSSHLLERVIALTHYSREVRKEIIDFNVLLRETHLQGEGGDYESIGGSGEGGEEEG